MFNPCSASVQGRRECPPPCAPHAPAAMGHLFQVAPVTAAPSTQAAHANACCLNPTGKQSAAYRLQAQQQDQCDPPWATPQAQQHSPARVTPTPQCCPDRARAKPRAPVQPPTQAMLVPKAYHAHTSHTSSYALLAVLSARIPSWPPSLCCCALWTVCLGQFSQKLPPNRPQPWASARVDCWGPPRGGPTQGQEHPGGGRPSCPACPHRRPSCGLMLPGQAAPLLSEPGGKRRWTATGRRACFGHSASDHSCRACKEGSASLSPPHTPCPIVHCCKPGGRQPTNPKVQLAPRQAPCGRALLIGCLATSCSRPPRPCVHAVCRQSTHSSRVGPPGARGGEVCTQCIGTWCRGEGEQRAARRKHTHKHTDTHTTRPRRLYNECLPRRPP